MMKRTTLMHKLLLPLAAVLAVPLGTITATAPAMAQAGQEENKYSVEKTRVDKLLQNPAIVEILKKYIPTVYADANFQTMGLSQTLRFIQQFEPNALSDDVLKQLQAEFDKVPYE